MTLVDNKSTGSSSIDERVDKLNGSSRLAETQSSGENDVEEGQDDDEDEEDPIATIRGMTINVDNAPTGSNGRGSSQKVASSPASSSSLLAPPAKRGEGNNLSAPGSASSNGGVGSGKEAAAAAGSTTKASSLRSLLGVPPPRAGPPQNAGNSLLVPPSTSSLSAPPGVGGASGARIGGAGAGVGGKTFNKDGLETIPSEIAPKRRKVILGPGCSALDWARLKSTIPPQARGFQKITPSELKKHKSLDDAWSAFNGKVYDMTPYLRFHPGGKEELMRVAGRDGTRLFMLTHSWVNIDSMIDSCIVGVLVSESS